MASYTQGVTDSTNDHIKNKFYRVISDAHINTFTINNYPKNEAELDHILLMLKNSYKEATKMFSRFRVTRSEGKDVLVSKVKNGEKYLKVVPLEGIYDTIQKVHLELAHRRKQTCEKLCENYDIPIAWIKLFFNLCPVCNNSVILNTILPNLSSEISIVMPNVSKHTENTNCYPFSVVEVSVRSLFNTPDNHFTTVLLYVDKYTRFLIMRPLRNESPHEIAFELLKIFADLSVPLKIEVNKALVNILERSIIILKNLNLKYELPTIYGNSFSKGMALCIAQTMQLKSCLNIETDWAIVISMIQWEINTSQGLESVRSTIIQDNIIMTPYHTLFGCIPKCGYFESNLKVVEGNGDSKESLKHNRLLCSKCQWQVFKLFQCHKCCQPFHFMCCERKVMKTYDQKHNKMITTCFTCKEAIKQLL